MFGKSNNMWRKTNAKLEVYIRCARARKSVSSPLDVLTRPFPRRWLVLVLVQLRDTKNYAVLLVK